MKTPKLRHRLLATLLAPLLILTLPPPLHAAVTGRSEDSSLAGTEKLLSDSSGVDTYITVSTLNAAQTYAAGLTASGSSSWDFSGSTGAFKTSTGLNTFGGSGHAFASALYPVTTDGAALGSLTNAFSDLFLASGAVINLNNDFIATHSAGILTVGTGDLRVTTPGTNAASVPTLGSTSSLSNKTLVTPVISTGLTASGSAANTFAGSTGTFITSTGVNTFKGSAHNFDAVLQPTTNDAAALGTTSLGFSDLHLATGALINVANGNAVITHSSGIFTVSTGDLRVTTAGTNAASVVTVGGTQTLTNKTLTAPVLGEATATSINGLTIDSSTGTFDLTDGKTLAVTGTLTLAGTDSTTMTFPATSSTVMTSSLSSNSIGVLNSVWGASNALVWEGATADTAETSLATVDPTADQTVSIPNFAVDFALLGSSLTTNTISAANSIWGASNALVFEGSSADDHEISITPANATADVVYLLPDAAAASYALMSSTLTTNAPDAANSVTGASAALVFEGSSADTSETTLTATNPTGDRTVTLADASGTVMLSSLATNAPDAANSVTGASAALVFEGTADAHETSLTATDATADRTVTIPNATGTVHLAQASTTTALTADDQAVTPGSNTVLQLTSDNATATNRTFTLSATGAITGQIYVLIGPATNQCEIADTGIQVLSAAWSPTTGDTLTLLFDGTNFNEIARSNN